MNLERMMNLIRKIAETPFSLEVDAEEKQTFRTGDENAALLDGFIREAKEIRNSGSLDQRWIAVLHPEVELHGPFDSESEQEAAARQQKQVPVRVLFLEIVDGALSLGEYLPASCEVHELSELAVAS